MSNLQPRASTCPSPQKYYSQSSLASSRNHSLKRLNTKQNDIHSAYNSSVKNKTFLIRNKVHQNDQQTGCSSVIPKSMSKDRLLVRETDKIKRKVRGATNIIKVSNKYQLITQTVGLRVRKLQRNNQQFTSFFQRDQVLHFFKGPVHIKKIRANPTLPSQRSPNLKKQRYANTIVVKQQLQMEPEEPAVAAFSSKLSGWGAESESDCIEQTQSQHQKQGSFPQNKQGHRMPSINLQFDSHPLTEDQIDTVNQSSNSCSPDDLLSCELPESSLKLVPPSEQHSSCSPLSIRYVQIAHKNKPFAEQCSNILSSCTSVNKNGSVKLMDRSSKQMKSTKSESGPFEPIIEHGRQVCVNIVRQQMFNKIQTHKQVPLQLFQIKQTDSQMQSKLISQQIDCMNAMICQKQINRIGQMAKLNQKQQIVNIQDIQQEISKSQISQITDQIINQIQPNFAIDNINQIQQKNHYFHKSNIAQKGQPTKPQQIYENISETEQSLMESVPFLNTVHSHYDSKQQIEKGQSLKYQVHIRDATMEMTNIWATQNMQPVLPLQFIHKDNCSYEDIQSIMKKQLSDERPKQYELLNIISLQNAVEQSVVTEDIDCDNCKKQEQDVIINDRKLYQQEVENYLQLMLASLPKIEQQSVKIHRQSNIQIWTDTLIQESCITMQSQIECSYN